MDERQRLSRVQAAVLDQMVEVGARLDLGRIIPERLTNILAEYQFGARSFRAIQELIRMGYLRRQNGPQHMLYEVQDYTIQSVNLGTDSADPLPHSQSIRSLCNAYGTDPATASMSSLSVGRPTGESDDDDEDPEPIDVLSAQRLGYLADLKFVKDTRKVPANTSLSIKLIERQWPGIEDPVGRRNTIQVSGWIVFDREHSGWKCTAPAEKLLRDRRVVSTLTKITLETLIQSCTKLPLSTLRL